MAESFGWVGTILFIDLSSGSVTRVATADYRPEEVIGGVGLNARIFWEMGCPEVEAYHPDNPLIISTGPLTGTYGPFGRAVISTISPQCYPKELFNYSSVGGRFPSELKRAGYDALVIRGKSEVPVYMSIDDGEVAVKSAEDAWGLDTAEAQQLLRTAEPGASMLVIGPAGENLSRISIILSETKFAAGVGGYGAVMGSKNLKAIAVRGTGSVKVAQPQEVIQLMKVIQEENGKVRNGRQWRGPYPASDEVKQIFADKYYVKQTGCYGCPQQCHSIHYIPGIGKNACSCANWCWVPQFSDAPKDIWEANVLMQRLGINAEDIIPGLPLYLREAHSRGLLSAEEIEGEMGLPATEWLGGTATDHEFLTVFLGKIAGGEFPYAEGAVRCMDHFAPKLAHTEELLYLQRELFTAHGYAYHAVSNLGTALHFATDTKDPVGSCHEYGMMPPEVSEHFGFPQARGYQLVDSSKAVYEGVERVVAWVQANQCLKNSLPMCEWWGFPSAFYNPPEMDIRIFESRIFSAVTGVDMDAGGLAKAAERIWTLRRAIMVKRENRTREGDILNEPYFEKSIVCYGGMTMGQTAGPIDRAKFEALKDRYYELCGADVKTGRPTRAKLEALGLKDVADNLASSGKLP